MATKHLEKYSGLPWWLSGEESACQGRRHTLDPRSGRIPRAAEQWGPCTTGIAATEPRAAAPEGRELTALQREGPCNRSSHTATGEKPRQHQRPSTATNQYITLFIKKRKVCIIICHERNEITTTMRNHSH